MRVLCIIGHGLYEPWSSILRCGQEVTWLARDLPHGFGVLHSHGIPVSESVLRVSDFHDNLRWKGPFISAGLRGFDSVVTLPLFGYQPKVRKSQRLHLRHDAIEVQMWDVPLLIRWKIRATLRFALENIDFDFVFMTTTSSYIYPNRLMDIVSGLPHRQYVGGAVIYPGANFAPGSNRLLSRDVVEDFLNDFWAQPASNLEDVSMSKSLKRLGYSISPLPHMSITSPEAVDTLDVNRAHPHYHYRVKSGPLNQRKDVSIMHKLDRKLEEMGFFSL